MCGTGMWLDAIPCCKSAPTLSSVPADLNGLKVHNAHLIVYSWPGSSLLCSFCICISPGSAAHVHHLNCPSPLVQESELSLAVWVHCPSGRLIVLTSIFLCEWVGQLFWWDKMMVCCSWSAARSVCFIMFMVSRYIHRLSLYGSQLALLGSLKVTVLIGILRV
jgi:hypothetical protein